MEQEIEYLLIEDIYAPVTEEDYVGLKAVIEDFIDCYEQNQDKPLEDWLAEKMLAELPEKTPEDVHDMVKEVLKSVQTFEDNKKSLHDHIAKRYNMDSWIASRVKEATSAMSTEQTVQYLQGLDNAVKGANESLTRTIITQAGEVNQNPCLNGFIAEQSHAQSFNMNAIARGSEYRAKVLESNGKRFARNSVDLVVVDGKGKIVRRYQVKYCKDAKATQKAFESGDYRGQQSLVPEGQADQMSRKASEFIEAPDLTRSNPLSKEKAMQMQEEARNGNWNDTNWNHYKSKDIALGIGKQAGQAALLGAAISVGTEVIEKLCKGENIDVKEVAKRAIEGGADFGLKATLTGAIKAGAEKGIIRFIPKGTPVGTIANVVFVGVEDAKVLYKYCKGELTGQEALAKMEETTVSAAGGMIAMSLGATKGAAIGSMIGALFCGAGAPIGAAIGGFIGATVAYMAGSAIGKMVVAARRKITHIVKKLFTWIMNGRRVTVTTASQFVRG